ETQLLGARLHVVAQALRPFCLAAATRMALRPLVHATEHMCPIEQRRIARSYAHERFSPDPRMTSLMPAQNAFWICSNPSIEAGTPTRIRVSMSIADIAFARRSCTSFISTFCIGATSGSPRKARASSGVQSMSMLTFMNLAFQAPRTEIDREDDPRRPG